MRAKYNSTGSIMILVSGIVFISLTIIGLLFFASSQKGFDDSNAVSPIAIWDGQNKKVSETTTNMGDISLNSSFTISGWIKPLNLNPEFPIVYKGKAGGGNHNYGFKISADGTYQYNIHNGDCTTWSGGSGPFWNGEVGKWNFFTVTYDSGNGNLTWYTNGHREGQSITSLNLCQNDYPTHVGIDTDTAIGQEKTANGYISDLRIYNYVKDVSAINKAAGPSWLRFFRQ